MLGFWSGIADKRSGDWVVNEELKSVVRNYVVFKQLESQLIERDPFKYRGAYLLVNSPTTRLVYETFDPAWRNKSPHGFLGRIGIEDSSEEVLALGAIEKPPNFDNLVAR